jgi:hypothetical protein
MAISTINCDGNIIKKSIIDTTSASGNLTIPVYNGYEPISAYCDSQAIRCVFLTRYQNTYIVRVFDGSLNSLTNTTVEVWVYFRKTGGVTNRSFIRRTFPERRCA